jgi:hypothetical protein
MPGFTTSGGAVYRALVLTEIKPRTTTTDSSRKTGWLCVVNAAPPLNPYLKLRARRANSIA